MDRVLEIGGYTAGYAGRLFARDGCDVVRVDGHEVWPGWVCDEADDLYLHAGKRRVRDIDAATLTALADRADVVICEAGSADALEALGFASWQTPVKIAVTPFGRTGPKRNWAATPATLLAMGGYTYLVGDADAAPLSLPGYYVEYQSGALAYAAANALRLSGRVESADISMLEVVMSLSQFTTVRWHCAGEIRGRHGSDFWFVVPSEMFRCQDGAVYINIVPAFWDALTVFIDRPELLVDPRFETNDLRMENREALHAYVAEAVAPMSRAELQRKADECRIPLGLVLSFDEVLADPHLSARDSWETIKASAGAELRAPRVPFRMGDSPGAQPIPAVRLEEASW